MSRINFSDNVKIHIISNNTDDGAKSCIPYLFHSSHLNDDACAKIINAINQSSPHKILNVGNEDLPLKMYLPNKIWCDDMTPIEVLNIFSKSRNIFNSFIDEFNMIVSKCIPKDTSASLEYTSNLYNIRVKIYAVSRL